MKALYPILLALALSACVTPYQQVYTSGEGDYYISETASGGGYYGGGTTLNHIGMYPWWSSGLLYSYYSPNFYPHHFYVWGPPRPFWHHYHPAWRGAWCPPYRRGVTVVSTGSADEDGGNEPQPLRPLPGPVIAMPIDERELWRARQALEYQRGRMAVGRYDVRTGSSGRDIGAASMSAVASRDLSRAASRARAAVSRSYSPTTAAPSSSFSSSRALSVSSNAPKSVVRSSASRSSASRSISIKKD